MGLFGKKKKAWDEGRIQENKAKMRALFEQVVEDAAGYQLVYAYSSSVKTSNYILARKTTYTYTSLIVGFREADMSIVILQTTPELEGQQTIRKSSEREKSRKPRLFRAASPFITRAVLWPGIHSFIFLTNMMMTICSLICDRVKRQHNGISSGLNSVSKYGYDNSHLNHSCRYESLFTCSSSVGGDN